MDTDRETLLSLIREEVEAEALECERLRKKAASATTSAARASADSEWSRHAVRLNALRLYLRVNEQS